MWQKQPHKSSYRESIKALEADIQHANTLAAALPRDSDGDCIQMKLSYSPFAPFLLFLIEWMDCSCTDTLPSYLGLLHIFVYKNRSRKRGDAGEPVSTSMLVPPPEAVYIDGMLTLSAEERKATLREFYAIIYPSLKQLEGFFTEVGEDYDAKTGCYESMSRNGTEEKTNSSSKDLERENECGICMENCTKMVLPDCGHSMCNSCFHDWNMRSQSCPFCRGSLKRVGSGDLWVLTSKHDVLDIITLTKENVRCFYCYIESLPLMVPEPHLFLYDYLF